MESLTARTIQVRSNIDVDIGQYIVSPAEADPSAALAGYFR